MDMNKESFRQEFSKKPEEYYSTELFRSEGFVRKRCRGCGKYFWTLDQSREFCGDSEHEPYSFIKSKMKELSYDEFWESFSEFFKKEGHSIVDKYPVVSRWRPDLYFTIASIQDFQRLENGKISFEYPKNPLLVPQMCMRFTDIPNVGVTGRHLTSFMMAGQHSFDYPKHGYWRDRTIELNFKFLTRNLKIPKEKISYVEDAWAMGDFSEFGPCIEGFSGGLELVNNVFTQFQYSNGKVSELDSKVVDVGWGFERLMWFYSGSQTLYDVVFSKELEYTYKNSGIKPDHNLYSKVASIAGEIDISEQKSLGSYAEEISRKSGISLKEYSDVIRPMQASYAIADHARSILFALSDGALPSNVGGGYNIRVIFRRSMDLMQSNKINIDLIKLMELSSKNMEHVYPGLRNSLPEISEVLKIEAERYARSKAEASKIVSQMLKSGGQLPTEKLAVLYQSNGITPEFIKSYAAEHGINVSVPDNVYSAVVKGDFAERKKQKRPLDFDFFGLKQTKKLYYDYVTKSSSKVLLSDGKHVILDSTPFYPEGGGQEADHGDISGHKVVDVQSYGGVIVHTLKEPHKFEVGKEVECHIDEERRIRLMAHHTATHLISAAARKLLGPHAWQEGAKKGPEKAHIDIAHYERLSDSQIERLERIANDYIVHGIKVTVGEMSRSEAEQEFGFSIYQGHGVPSSVMRIVQIRDLNGNLIDAEACGGLHLMGRETYIGLIKIIASYRIHDGINRIEFVAGPAAVDYISKVSKEIASISSALKSNGGSISDSVISKMNELTSYRKSYEALENDLAKALGGSIASEGQKLVVKELKYNRKLMRKVANEAVAANNGITVVLYNKQGEIIAVSGSKSEISALGSIKSYLAKNVGKASFKGGGSDNFAEGSFSFS
ncbi:MAG: alanine--tRNA ligase [Candidatus Micrarchaeaceae archaeon]